MPHPPLDDAFDAAPDPIVEFDGEGVLVRANAAFRATFRQADGAKRAPWGRVQPPPFSNGERRFDAAAPDGRVFEWRERLLADGRRIAAARDVSDRVKAADEAGRAKTVLFATLTHELRTPLNGVIGMAGLLQRARLEPAQAEWAGAIARSGEHLLELVNEILDYSRLEAGRVALEAAPFDVEDVAQSVVELLSPRARQKGLELAVMLRPGAPLAVVGDAGRVRQILFNLVGNAVKFTETGGVVVELTPSPIGPGLRFVVRDTGPGVPADRQAAIFEDFTQADEGISRRYGGAGLGLSIVRRLAQAMGGKAGLESRSGQGARFHVDLPLPLARAQPLGPAALEGVRVAIVTPSSVLAAALRQTLMALNAEVVAADPAAAPFPGADVVLVDGAALPLASIQALGSRAIVLAAQEEREALEGYLAAGVRHYLIKPVRRRSLAERVLHAARGQPAPARAAEGQDPRAAAPRNLGLKVLVAEDNPINALLAKTLLQRHGCAVSLAGDGEQTVAAARAGGFDVVLMDLRMPVLDGYAAARQIRALKGPAGQVALIALTADAGGTEEALARAAGMDDFLTKPIDPARLEAALARLSDRANPAMMRARRSGGEGL